MSRTLLYVESGTLGGGSFQSLLEHLRVLDRTRYRPVVAFLNPNRLEAPIAAMRIPVHMLTDPVFSVRVPRIVRGGLARVTSIAGRAVPATEAVARGVVHAPSIAALSKLARAERAAALHLNGQVHRDFFGALAASRARVPCVSHLRSLRSEGFTQALARRANELVAAYVANSRATRDHWVARGVDPGKVRVVYNGLPADIVEAADVRGSFGLPKQAPVVACVANLASAKGHDVLLDAFAILARSDPSLHLLLVGDGPLRAALERQARRLGTLGRVVFAGPREDARALLAGADVAVVPSRSEGFGRVLLEAMGAGVPIVATRVGAVPEVVEDGRTALLVAPGDPAALAEAVRRVLGDSALSRRLARAARADVRQRFSIQAYAAAMDRVYTEVTGP